MLISYVDIVGSEPVLQSIKMFESVMPEYMALLKQYRDTQSYPSLVEEAHKIKGAAGSVGLKRVQELAQKAQSPELPDWKENVEQWIQLLDEVYEEDISMLKRWLWR